MFSRILLLAAIGLLLLAEVQARRRFSTALDAGFGVSSGIGSQQRSPACAACAACAT